MGPATALDAGAVAGLARRTAGPRAALAERLLVPAILPAALALLGLQEFRQGHFGAIDEYDDGVYFGAAVNLGHGLFPYVDYGFIQPPVSSLILLPFAWLSEATGTRHAFEAARLFICAVALLNIWLMARLLRGRPPVARATGMALMIIYPGSLSSAQTVLIEPLLVLGCLLAMTAAFTGGTLSTSDRRQLVAGLVFGVAVATKVWAAAPLAAVIWLAWFNRGRGLRWRPALQVLATATAGFLLLSLPFAIRSPGAYLNQVFVTQAVRPQSGYHWPRRLADLSGFAGLTHAATALRISEHQAAAPIIVLATIVGVLILVNSRGARPMLDLEWFAVLTSCLTIVMFLSSPSYYYHYSGFAGPFVAIAAARLVEVITCRRPRPGAATLAAAVTASLLAAVAIGDIVNVARAPAPQRVPAAVRNLIPKTGCVLYLEPSVGLLIDRYTGARSGCAHVVDYLGEERVFDHGHSQEPRDERNESLQRHIQGWLSSSSAVVVGGELTSWGPAVRAYVAAHFERHRFAEDRMDVYVRTPRAP